MFKKPFTVKEIKQFYNMTRFDNLKMVLEKGIESKQRRVGYTDMADQGVMDERRTKTITYTNPLTESKSSKVLWRFANLYINPHNATLWRAHHEYGDMIIFCVSPSILQRGDVILSDRNAATKPAAFFASDKFKISEEDAIYLTRGVSRTKDEQGELAELDKYETAAQKYLMAKDGYLARNYSELGARRQASQDVFNNKEQYGYFFNIYEERKERANHAKHVRQAEALARTRIDPRFITGILVADEDNKKNVEAVLLEMNRADIKVTVSPSMFWLNKNGRIQSSLPLTPPPFMPDSAMLTSWLAEPRNLRGVPDDISDSESLDEMGDVALAYFLADPALIKRLRLGKLEQNELDLKATVADCLSENVKKNHQAFILCVKTNDDKTISLSQIAKAFVFSLQGRKLLKNLTKGHSFNVQINPGYFPLEKEKAVNICKAKIISGNVINSTMPVLVNTVNCTGIMGAGVALAFKDRYREMYSDYKKRCRAGQVVLGIPYLWKDTTRSIINFPTKSHWQAQSKVEDIVSGLEYLAKNLKLWGVRRLAIPALGCNNGGLDFTLIRPLIEKYLLPLDIELEIYEPITSKSPKYNKRKSPAGFFQPNDHAKKARTKERRAQTFSASV